MRSFSSCLRSHGFFPLVTFAPDNGGGTGGHGAMGWTAAADLMTEAEVCADLGWTADELLDVRRTLKLLRPVYDPKTGELRILRIDLSSARVAGADYVMSMRKAAKKKPEEVRQLGGTQHRTVEFLAERNGVLPEVLLQLMTDNAFEADVCPATGVLIPHLPSFDQFWRNGGAQKARRMSSNILAQRSADEVKAAAAKKSRDQIIKEGREQETIRAAEQRARFNKF